MMRSLAAALALIVATPLLAAAQDTCPEPAEYWKCPASYSPAAPKPQRFTARVQARYSHTADDPDQPTWLLRDDRHANDDYNTRRLRLAYSTQTSQDLLFFGQVRRDWGADEFELHDLYLTWDSGRGPKVSVGQMATPFDRQFLTTDVRLPLVNRARSTILLMPDRDIGVLAHDADCAGGVGWYAGLFTGNGKNELDADGDIMACARVEWLATPHLNIAASYASRPAASVSNFDRFLRKNGDPYGTQQLYAAEQIDEEMVGFDALYLADGMSVWAGYTTKELSSPGLDLDACGWHIEATHFVPFGGRERALEIAAGYEDFDPNDAVVDQLDLRQWTLGCTYHIDGCRRQARLQYIHRDEGVDDVDNDSIVLQYEHIFD